MRSEFFSFALAALFSSTLAGPVNPIQEVTSIIFHQIFVLTGFSSQHAKRRSTGTAPALGTGKGGARRKQL